MLGAFVNAMSGGPNEDDSTSSQSRAGSGASRRLSAGMAESLYAAEAFSTEGRAELIEIILNRKVRGTMRESRALAARCLHARGPNWLSCCGNWSPVRWMKSLKETSHEEV